MQLGPAGHAISSDVAVREGAVLVGPDAEDLRISEPALIVPRVIDRVGDPIAIVSGKDELSGQELVAQIVVWVAQQVADVERADAQRILITVPASWGAHRRSLLLDALSDAGLPDAGLVSEPEAAVARYVDRNGWSDTAVVAVVAIGAAALRTAVVRGDGRDQQVLGVPDGYDGVSGRVFDDAITRHVAAALGVTLPTLGGTNRDEAGLEVALAIPDDAAAELRALCTEAKELLSIDTHITIEPTVLGAARVRMVRAELESLIRKPVITSVDALRRTVRSAGLSADDISAVLLVGGSAQVPLIAEVFSSEFGRPVEVDPDPSFALALGAARLAADLAGTPIEFDEEDLDEDEHAARGFALHWRRPRKPAILVAAACVLALMSAGGLVAATANQDAGQSEQRPSRAVNLTTSPTPTPGADGLLTDSAAAPASADAGIEGARADGPSTPAGTAAPGGASARPSATPSATSDAPAVDASTPAVITPVTITGTAQPSAAPSTTAASTAPATSTSTSTSEPPTPEPSPSSSSSSTSPEPPPTTLSAAEPPPGAGAGEPTDPAL